MDARRFNLLRIEFDALSQQLKVTQDIERKRELTRKVEQLIAESNRLVQENRRDLHVIRVATGLG